MEQEKDKLEPLIPSPILDEKDDDAQLGPIQLPSKFIKGDVGYFQLYDWQNEPILAEVLAVIFRGSKVHYDLELSLPKYDGPNIKTRVYNIDSAFLHEIN